MTVILAAAAFAATVRRVAFAAEAERFGRPILEGVSARVAGSSLILAAADGFRLAYERVPLVGDGATLTLDRTRALPQRASCRSRRCNWPRSTRRI